MKILVTGAKGFIGKNLVAELKNQNYTEIYEYDINSKPKDLDAFCRTCDFVFHLAGVNRPKDQKEFIEGNYGFTSILLEKLKLYNNKSPIMLASSIQAELDNPYGISKKSGEDLLFNYGNETGSKILIYRFPNVFGKWSRPNYNSVIATFCYNIAHDIPIQIDDESTVMNLVYIDDVIKELVRAAEGYENRKGLYCEVPIVYTKTLGTIVELIYSFKLCRKNKTVPNMLDEFTKKLYSTYLSYLPVDQFVYELDMNIDYRGSFTEFIKSPERGQISVNISKPGITKGNHWHHTKNEKFLVVSGQATVRFRKIDSDKIIEYFVSGEKMRVVDIPTGYVHNITNIGDTDLIIIIWANEVYNPKNSDTHYLEV